MNNQKIKLIIEASKSGRKKLEEVLKEFLKNIEVVNDSSERIEFIYDFKKYRIAYGKEGLKKNFIEYQNYKRLAFRYDSNSRTITSTRSKAYLENLEILSTIANNEKRLIQVKENISIKDLEDIRIIVTKEGYHEDLKTISESGNDYFKLKRAINELQKNSIIGKLRKESINIYSDMIMFNEFSNLCFIGKLLRSENKSILHLDLEDFLLNGNKLDWEPSYVESYFNCQNISLENLKEYLEYKASVENEFKTFYESKESVSNLVTDINFQEEDNYGSNQIYYNNFSENSDNFGVDWNSIN